MNSHIHRVTVTLDIDVPDEVLHTAGFIGGTVRELVASHPTTVKDWTVDHIDDQGLSVRGGQKEAVYCSKCGSTSVSYDARQDANTGEVSLYDDTTCGDCDYDGRYFRKTMVPASFEFGLDKINIHTGEPE